VDPHTQIGQPTTGGESCGRCRTRRWALAHEVVKAAATAAAEASNPEDPAKAYHEAEVAAERALALPNEAKEAAEAALKIASLRKGRTVAELAAADVAKAAENEMEKTGEGFAAVTSAHMKAAEYEHAFGAGKGYMYDFPKEPPKQAGANVAMTHGMTAMWASFRAGESPGNVVQTAVKATKIAGGTEQNVEQIIAIASDPETFVSVKSFENAEKIGEAAARTADESGWPLQHVALAAGRAAADAQQRNPKQGPEDVLAAAEQAATWVMNKRHQTTERVAREAAAEAKAQAEAYGHPDAKVQILTARAAAMAAAKHGAPPATIKQYVDEARNSVKIDNSGWDTQQWNGRVYTEYDRKTADDLAQQHSVMGEDYVEPVKYGKVAVNLGS